MKIEIVKIGRVAYPEIRSLVEVYKDRLAPFAKVEDVEFKDEASFQKSAFKKSDPGRLLVALDERGQEWTSRQLSEQLRRWTDDPQVKTLTFFIGGPMGLDPALKKEARCNWALSKATFTSDMAWLLCWEQLYRAHTILKGTGYHHD